jgi:hypothetical protein
MFVHIINPALTTADLVFQSAVIHPDTQEVLFPKGSRFDYRMLPKILSLGIDMVDVDDDLG